MEFADAGHFLHSFFLFLSGMLIKFSESVDCFPVYFFVDVVLEVCWVCWGEDFADLAEGTSEEFCFFGVCVVAFFTCHIIRWGENL